MWIGMASCQWGSVTETRGEMMRREICDKAELVKTPGEV